MNVQRITVIGLNVMSPPLPGGEPYPPDTKVQVGLGGAFTMQFIVDLDSCPQVGDQFDVPIQKVPVFGLRIGEPMFSPEPGTPVAVNEVVPPEPRIYPHT